MTPLVIYVDVDDTLIRSVGSKRIMMTHSVKQVKALHAEGAELYCWSSGGAEYAKASAVEAGIEDCFKDFLPKPQVMLDDQPVEDWKYLTYLHPNNAGSKTVGELDPMRDLRRERL